MTFTERVLAARQQVRSLHKPHTTEPAMPEVSFPKHPQVHIDSESRLHLKLADGPTQRITNVISFVNQPWGKEMLRRMTVYHQLQKSLASALYCVKKFHHAKTKGGALNDADKVALTTALQVLRASRGAMDQSINSGSEMHGLSFIEAIDKSFKEGAVAASASIPAEGE